MDLVRAHPWRCVGTLSWVRNGHRAPKQTKMAINGPFVVISRPSGYKLVDKGGINSGHFHGNVLGQFPGSGMANEGRHMFQKGLFAFLWLFGLVVALLDHNGHPGSAKRFQHMLIHHFGAPRPAYGHKRIIYGLFRSFGSRV